MNIQEQTFAVLALLADPEKFKKQLAVFRSSYDQAQEVVKLVGPAREISAIRSMIEQEQRKAKEKIALAREEADELIGETKTEAGQILESARKKAAELIETAQDKVDDASRRQTQGQETLANAQRFEGTLRTREKELAIREAALDVRRDSMAELEKQLLKEKSELAAVRDTLKAVTG